MDWADFLTRFGLPLTALAAVIFGSATGTIIWKGAHEKIVAVLEARNASTDEQRIIAMAGWKDSTAVVVELSAGLKTQNELVMRLVNERGRGP